MFSGCSVSLNSKSILRSKEVEASPTARVTLQQKIANNITFTYIEDSQPTNAEIIRMEWAFSPKFSAVALRDFNGNVSLEFFYRFKKR